MAISLVNGRVVTPEQIVNGGIVMENGRIASILRAGDVLPAGETVDCGGAYICPGFVDIHNHGAYGATFFTEDRGALNRGLDYHGRHGTTALLPTTASGSYARVLGAVRNIKGAMEEKRFGPRILGAHLEGCWMNPKCAGAQNPAYLFPARPEQYMELFETGVVRRISASPEVEGVLEMARRLAPQGVCLSVAHSDADYAVMMDALDAGFTHVTHIYNAISMLSNCYYYPQVGACETALLHDEFTVEAICDGRHVPPQLLRLMYKIKGPDGFHGVTDAVFSGAPDGPCEEFGMQCLVEDDVCMLADRSAFAGSVATCDKMLRVLVNDAQIPLCDAVKMLTLTPARQIGAKDIGRIAVGMRADVNIIGADLQLKETYIGGERFSRA